VIIKNSFQFPVSRLQISELATGNWKLETGNWKLETISRGDCNEK